MTLTAFLTEVGYVFTQVIDWIPDVFSAMLTSPVILCIFACALIGTVIAFAKKILG